MGAPQTPQNFTPSATWLRHLGQIMLSLLESVAIIVQNPAILGDAGGCAPCRGEGSVCRALGCPQKFIRERSYRRADCAPTHFPAFPYSNPPMAAHPSDDHSVHSYCSAQAPPVNPASSAGSAMRPGTADSQA